MKDDRALAILNPAHWPRPRGYANGMMARGRVVMTGGVVGWHPVTSVFPESFLDQTRNCLTSIVTILAEGGATPQHLLRLTWYVTDIETYLADLAGLSAVYRETIGKHYPAMALVQVVRLVERKAMVEIEATAVVPDLP